MMKITLFITIACSLFYQTSANVGVLLLLNHGETSGQECTSTEWASVVKTTDDAYDRINRRRNLRQLQSYPTWCEEKCKYQAKYHCTGRHPKCEGYRRLVAMNDGSVAAPAFSPHAAPAPAPAPVLAPTAPFAQTCQADIDEINASLNQLRQSLTSGSACRSVLNATKREYQCLTTIDNCRVQKIQLMNAGNNTLLIDDFTNGMSFCNSRNAAFKAISDPCVCNVHFTVKNAKGLEVHSDLAYNEPFASSGKTFEQGAYTLEYYPDSDKSLIKTIAFTSAASAC